MNELATNYLMTGDPDRAAALYREALPIERELYPRDIQTARTLEGLSYGLVRQVQGQEALQLAEEALGIAIESHRGEQPGCGAGLFQRGRSVPRD